ncbi:protein kinase [Mycobacterium sp. E1319]|uniref:protein kinase domain-containing protein n=1 Tax=Mycobacterium sp. E1319 TaxID=1834124 RepID=UPI0007FCB92C|nr:protein kinase [Mycobacterium sp. E1319]OBH21874.1 serine/threonine protein kinase [Mycobacterium sp. E1319]
MGDASADSRVGSQLGPYRLRRLVGRGGMGDVYEAEDTVRDRVVALKLMSPALSGDPVFRSRMQREARTAGRLQEPHVVPIHDYGEIDGQLYVDMRLIDGTDLARLLKTYGPLAPPHPVAIVRQVGAALDAAHATGVLHRDVKPENILVSAADFAYLVDFGIASAASDEQLTQSGSTVGTTKYMAPERFRNGALTPRADIYALTCVLYECLTGSPPYTGDHLSVLGGHLHRDIPRPSAARPSIPAAFDAVIARGMAKNPADRFATCEDLSAAAYAALVPPDRDRATDILSRSRAARLPGPSDGPAAPPAMPATPPVLGNTAPPPVLWATAPVPGNPFGPPPQPTGWVPPPVYGVGVPGPGMPAWGPPPKTGRKPWLWVGVGTAVAAVVAAAVVLAVGRPWEPTPRPTPASPPPAPDAVALRVLNDGVLVGSSAAPTTIDVFNEPICPSCGNFIRSNADALDTAVNNKKLAVRYHLLNFLDDQSHSKTYSTRAVAATYCVAARNDPKIYTDFYSGLFASTFQPREHGAEDHTDGELAQLAVRVGADAEAVACINAGDDLGIARTKAASGYATLSAYNSGATPFVWDGTASVDFSDPNWLSKLTG